MSILSFSQPVFECLLNVRSVQDALVGGGVSVHKPSQNETHNGFPGSAVYGGPVSLVPAWSQVLHSLGWLVCEPLSSRGETSEQAV